MESETAQVHKEAPEASKPLALPPFLACLEGRIDPRALAKLAKLGEDYTETQVILRCLDGAKEVDRFGPLPLSNFEPDFVEAAALTTGGGRVSVEIQPPNGKPWRFQIELPEAEEARPAMPATPIHASTSGDSQLAIALAEIAAANARMAQLVQNVSDRMIAIEARPVAPIDSRSGVLMQQIEMAVHDRVLAAVKGEDPIADKAIDTALSRVRKLLHDAGEIKTLAEEASATLGAAKAVAEEDPVALAERAATAVDKFSATRIGSRLMDRFFPEAPATPLLTHESSGEDVKAVYG